ncbi:serine/threonine-protein kinase/endoribonuclease IRE1 [Exaiptasia diaphana]|uniref:Protein kinase domain-containing protein n=1 Tax=Exaiptasia diaphana TaxID=2652724 RepID=A0A913X987_EXADI|nr:serine/threonine-protein kinase/endoribonuclease IRE1 [Exaiptasia diaphana]
MGFDLWTCDRNGDSVISILIKENSFELADDLIENTCNNSRNLQDPILVGVLNAICKDESTQTTWKSILVEKWLKKLKSTRRSLDMSLPLRSCCMNIIDYYATIGRTETTEFDSVHYEIVKQLLRYGASGESCLDVAEGCPPLKTLLSTPVSMEERPFIIPWTSLSQKHKNQLAEVARGLNCNFQEPYWYHNKEIGRGAFGQVFVGIHGKDSMEVAVKRVHYTQQDRDQDIREIRSLAPLLECEHIVRYLTFLQTDDYSYIIMELLEGNLTEYFDSAFYDQRQTKVLCRDVVQGLKYLHEQKIIHRDLKPKNILYRTDPKLCLKIADFGLSRRIDVITFNTVMATGVGTRGWIAPEVMTSTAHEHSRSSDVFSCGLVFHYILSKDHRHPFSPADCADKSELEIIPKTETNILNNKMEGWDSGLDPEASHVITGMLNCTNEKERPTASMLLHHPMFWSKKKKLDFLSAVGNQEEFECPRAKRPAPSSGIFNNSEVWQVG